MNKNIRWVYILIASLIVAALLSPFASSFPDGLERVSQDLGIEEKGVNEFFTTPFSDYRVSYIKNDFFSTAISGIIGTITVFALSYGLGHIIARKMEQ
ncbi:MAG: PDGLE domain-containing protein [Thermovenabulum sp.]|uniref:PDGLE domain-containing protein n=1 Tax=Thermovenabulum sp. TaxID=3100335 RepID=UPI003C7B78B2